MALEGKMVGLPFPLRVKIGWFVVESGNLFMPLPADLYSQQGHPDRSLSDISSAWIKRRVRALVHK